MPKQDALLTLNQSGGTTVITRRSVNAALAGVNSTSQTLLQGVQVGAPRAIAWDSFTQQLYLVDELSVGNSYALRLSAFTGAGAGHELWRTNTYPQPQSPTSVYLSTSYLGEIVLGVNTVAGMDLVLLDRSGAPLRSVSGTGKLGATPMASQAYVTVPLRVAMTTQLDLRIESATRNAMPAKICGAGWLRTVAAGILQASGCP